MGCHVKFYIYLKGREREKKKVLIYCFLLQMLTTAKFGSDQRKDLGAQSGSPMCTAGTQLFELGYTRQVAGIRNIAETQTQPLYYER